MRLHEVAQRHRTAMLKEWIAVQQRTRTGQLMSAKDLERQCRNFLDALVESPATGDEIPGKLAEIAVDLSRSRALQGFSPTETADFVLSLKAAVLPVLEQEFHNNPRELADEVRDANRYLDRIAVRTFEAYVAGREELIRQQAAAITELSTPVVEVWDGVVLVPLIGVVDTERSRQIMEAVLTKIVETGSSVVLIDITGVPMVDTAVAKHLLQTVQGVRLLGAESVICGISPRVAQTLVHLGVDLSGVLTRTTLAKGLKMAFEMNGHTHESGAKPAHPAAPHGV